MLNDRRVYTAACVGVGALLLAPYFYCAFVPGLDFPVHAAISRILWDLIRGEQLVYYELNLQPIAYYTSYLLSVPAAAVFGGAMGVRVVLGLTSLAIVSGLACLVRELNRGLFAFFATAVWLYNMFFFWGFLASYVGMAFFVWSAVLLLRYQRDRAEHRTFWLAWALGWLATLSHVSMVPLWFLLVLALELHRPGGWSRRLWLMVPGIGAGFPLVVRFIYRLLYLEGGKTPLLYSAADLVADFDRTLRPFADRFPRVALVGLLALSMLGAVIAIVRAAREPAYTDAMARIRFCLPIVLGCSLLFLAVPTRMKIGEVGAWGVNTRFIPYAGIALALMADFPKRFYLSQIITAVAGVLIVGYAISLNVFWAAFDREAHAVVRLDRQIQEPPKLAVLAQHAMFRDAWPPLMNHLPVYLVAENGGFANTIFNGGHLPIRANVELKAQIELGTPIELGDFDTLVVHEKHVDASFEIRGDPAKTAEPPYIMFRARGSGAGE